MGGHLIKGINLGREGYIEERFSALLFVYLCRKYAIAPPSVFASLADLFAKPQEEGKFFHCLYNVSRPLKFLLHPFILSSMAGVPAFSLENRQKPAGLIGESAFLTDLCVLFIRLLFNFDVIF